MPRGQFTCPGCGDTMGAKIARDHKEQCPKYQEKFSAETWNIDKETKELPAEEPKKWVKPKKEAVINTKLNEHIQPDNKSDRKMEARLNSMITEGIFSIDAEKLLACRKPEVRRVVGEQCLVIPIFRTRLGDEQP